MVYGLFEPIPLHMYWKLRDQLIPPPHPCNPRICTPETKKFTGEWFCHRSQYHWVKTWERHAIRTNVSVRQERESRVENR